MAVDASVSETQLQAERAHILRELVNELGGLAHEYMDTQELDGVIDNMLSKSFPQSPSVDLQRWIHTHRQDNTFKISQILGAQVGNVSPLVPECLGKFHDPEAPECRRCLDRVLCGMRTKALKSDNLVNIKPSYQLRSVTTDSLTEVLFNKQGQMARALIHGNKLILTLQDNKLRVAAVKHSPQLQEKNMGTKGVSKAKAAAAEPEELDEELELEGDDETLEDEDGEELEESEEEEEDDTDEGEDEEEEEEEVAPAKAAKPKKEPKPKTPLNPAQQKFQDDLNAMGTSAEKAAHSKKLVKSLKIDDPSKGRDERVDHMQRVMAIKKHYLTAGAAAKPAAAKKATKK